jgi:hypothetical protein
MGSDGGGGLTDGGGHLVGKVASRVGGMGSPLPTQIGIRGGRRPRDKDGWLAAWLAVSRRWPGLVA